MQLPFSHDAFLDLFGAYNALLWPGVAALWLVTAGVAWRWMRVGSMDGRVGFALLAVHWAWSGLGYHWLFFRRINPAAMWFGAFFVLQAVAFIWLAARRRGQITVGWHTRGVVGGILVSYALVYPLVGLAFGLRYPRLPVFAVPCPTTILTAGLLVTSAGVPRAVSLVPFLWAVVGSSAAFVLGIRADLALVVAAASLAFLVLLQPRSTR